MDRIFSGLLIFFLFALIFISVTQGELRDWIWLLIIVGLIISVWFGLYNTIVTIDKKSQVVTVKKDNLGTESIRKIPFHLIKKVEVRCNSPPGEDYSFRISLVSYYDKPIDVYGSVSESNIEKVAEKIRKITGPEISYENYNRDYHL